MQPQNLEDLLKVKQFFYSDAQEAAVVASLVEVDINAEGGRNVISTIACNTPKWLGRKVQVKSKTGELKEISFAYKPDLVAMQVEVTYFKVDEVDNF